MEIKLSSSEEKGLLLLHKSTKEKRKADRIKLILLLHKGYSQKEVSEILFLDRERNTTLDTKQYGS